MRPISFKRKPSPKTVLLMAARKKYPYRLVRNHDVHPDPKQLDKKMLGEFARFPGKDGDEWLFETREGRDRFLEFFSGTELGDR